MPLISTRGAASAQGFGEFAQSGPVNYIEDVFSCFLYTGNGSTQTITNGIDLSGKGGLVWIKGRSLGYSHYLANTNRGASKYLATNRSDAENYNGNYTDTLTSFNSNGFSLGADSLGSVNTSGDTYASWTFRKQAKFFDVVTYTGTGSNTTITHNLGSVPGCIIVKRTDTTADWQVYHRANTANPETDYLVLSSAAATADSDTRWNDTLPTSTVFSIGTDATVNANGGTYVAYLFAHDAGGFGLAGTDNVISCGSFTTDGSGNATVTLGYEPQWVLTKQSSGTGNWSIVDSMRGNATLNGTTSTEQVLRANSSIAEFASYGYANPTSTGFVASGWAASETLIYIAIRRGPMKVPTLGTSVYYGETYTGNGTARSFTSPSFPPDLFIARTSGAAEIDGALWSDRLRGSTKTLYSAYTQGEGTNAQHVTAFGQNGVSIGTSSSINGSGTDYIGWNLRRAPGFFDVVCYTGTGSSTTVAHNLGAVPQLIIVKRRDSTSNWMTGCNFTASVFQYLDLNSGADGGNTNGYTGYFGAQPTASVFTPSPTSAQTNTSGATYVAYLFATVAGVSKVGSYTGTGTTKQIDCGFTGGARFVLIKRLGTSTDPGIGDWYVYDSARGIVSGNDPFVFLNTIGASTTNTDYVDTYSAGFELSSTAPAALNANGGTFIFLAIA